MFFVYILTNRKHGTPYTGVTGGLLNRLNLHRDGAGSEFVRKYHLNRPVCALPFSTAAEAIAHEKRLKRWRRAWKIQLIERDNPEWRDLLDDQS